MNEPSVIPATYHQWRECITVRCGIPLTTSYIDGRLAEIRSGQHPKTIEFIRLYGRPHWQQTVDWFEQARREAAGG